MTTTVDPTVTSATSLLPGAAVIARIRRLLYVTIATGVLYSTFTIGMKAGCPGGVDANGGFIDANGNPTDFPPDCVTLNLGPSPIILILIAGVVLWALGRVLHRADSEASAMRILDRAAIAVIIIAAVSLLIAHVWFALIPLYGVDDTGTYYWPFPFGSVNMQTSPMPAP